MAKAHTRRDFVRLSAAAGTATASAAVLPIASAFPQASPIMLTRSIPQSNAPLPVVGIGTWQTFDIPQIQPEMNQRTEVLRVLFDAGGTVVDSSPMYGRAEAVVGALLWSQFFLKYILGHAAVTCVIPGTAKQDHMRDNVAAGIGRLPDEAQRKRMAAFWDEL